MGTIVSKPRRKHSGRKPEILVCTDDADVCQDHKVATQGSDLGSSGGGGAAEQAESVCEGVARRSRCSQQEHHELAEVAATC